MKKTLLFFAILFATAFGFTAQAVESHIVACTAGNLATVATSYLTTVTNLTVTGTIDARDFKTMRDAMPKLAVIDLSGSTVSAYTGTEGTGVTFTTDYPANEIPSFAFCIPSVYEGKTSLTSFIYPSSVTSIGMDAFDGCIGFTGSLTIPSSVTTIAGDAFRRCSGFTGSLIIPSSVTTIDHGAFSECSGFTGSLTIPASIRTISAWAFSRCSGFTGSLTLPTSLTSISMGTFDGCSGFTGPLTIPASITSIFMSAFNGCSGLTSIYAYATTPIDISASPNVFYDVNKTTCFLHVPVGSKGLYETANQWKDFSNIVEGFPTSINEISNNSIILYPNPANSTITVSELGTLASDQSITLSITDISGNTLLTKSIEPSLNSATIDVSSLKSGAYVMVIQSGNGNVVKRFLKR